MSSIVFQMGSSGGGGYLAAQSGSGGGMVSLYAENVVISGVVDASGTDASEKPSSTNAQGGGGSGGCVKIVARFLSVTGSILANGGKGASNRSGGSGCSGGGGGSGGLIYVEASTTGGGTLRANGGNGGEANALYSSTGSTGGGGGGGGWIRVLSRTAITPSFSVAGGAGGPSKPGYYGYPGQSGVVENIRLPPEAPQLLSPLNNENVIDRVTFSWNNALGADSYQLIVDDDPFFESPEVNISLSGTSYVTSLPAEATYYWKVKAVNTGGENVSETRRLTFRYRPEIIEIQADNRLVDRKKDTDFATTATATRISVTIRDNGGAPTIAIKNVRLWIRAFDNSVVVDNQQFANFETVDENTRRFTFVFDPPDSLPVTALGPFDVQVWVSDVHGITAMGNYEGRGKSLFTVDDLQVGINLADNTPIYQLVISGNSFRVYDNASTTLDNVVVVDNNEGLIQASFTGNSYYKSYGLVSPVRLGRGDLGRVYVWARDNVLDGVSPALTYQVEGDNVKFLNFIVNRQSDQTSVTFDATWSSDGIGVSYGTPFLPENSQLTGNISSGNGSITIPHSSRVNSGNKTLSLFDNTDRPLWNVQSQTFYFNILPVALGLRGDNRSLPARVTPRPVFGWVFQDNNPNDSQLGVRIQVGSTPHNNDLWDWTDAGFTAQEVTYGGLDLVRGQTYYIRMIVRDSQLEWQNADNAECWTRSSFTVNQLPVTSDLLVEDEVNPRIDTLFPTFSWTYSDPDGDGQSHYQVWVGSSPGSNDMWDSGEVISSAGSAKYSGAPLSWGRTYHVQVRTKDGLEWSEWAKGTFTLIDNNPPTQIQLVSPPNGSSLGTSTVTLSWESATDSESGVDHYELSISGRIYTVLGTSKSLPLSHGNYSWRVRAVDAAGNAGPWSEEWTFSVNVKAEGGAGGGAGGIQENADNAPPRVVWIDVDPSEILHVAFECWDESGISSVEVWIDNRQCLVNWDGRKAEVTEENIGEGLHTVLVRVADILGNENLLLLNYTVKPHREPAAPSVPPVVSSMSLSGRLLRVQILNGENRRLALRAHIYVDGRLFRVLPLELQPLEPVSVEVEMGNLSPGEHVISIQDAEGHLLGSESISIHSEMVGSASPRSTPLWLAGLAVPIAAGLGLRISKRGRKVMPAQVKMEEIPEVVRALAPLLREEKND